MLGHERILVIHLGGIRAFTMATGAFQSLRTYHKDAQITILTTAELASVAHASGYFDAVWVDGLAPWYAFGTHWAFYKRFQVGGFRRVYDMTQNARTEYYFRFCGRHKPEWVSHVVWASHPYTDPARFDQHILDRYEAMLQLAGLEGQNAAPDISFLTASITHFHLPEKYALIAPGSRAEVAKDVQWYEEGYAEVMRYLAQHGITPVIVGGAAEIQLASDIIALTGDCGAVSLANQTTLEELAEVARGAQIAIGGMCGPMFLIATAKCPVVMLFSGAYPPELSAPIEDALVYVQSESLHQLEAAEVTDVISRVLRLDLPVNTDTSKV